MTKAREPITDFSPKIPLEVYEARNAVAIAQSCGRGYAGAGRVPEGRELVEQAESLLARKANKKEVIAAARDAVQTAADARQIAAAARGRSRRRRRNRPRRKRR